jgi:hypothetical protein
MKYYAGLIVVFALAVFLVTCKSEEEMAKKTARDFLECVNSKKFDRAKKLATPESSTVIEFMKMFAETSQTAPNNQSIENLNCNIVEDTAHCMYLENGEEKTILLVKNGSKWLVDMKKETPPVTNMDSTSVSNDSGYNYTEPDTTTYFDFILSDMKEVNGSTQFVFQVTNRSEWNISHLWFDVYFSDKSGKFIKQKQIIFDGILKNSMLMDISNADEIRGKNKSTLMLENTRIDDIGEIFLLPVRLKMEDAYYEQDNNSPYVGVIYYFTNEYVLIKNNTDYNVKITFE